MPATAKVGQLSALSVTITNHASFPPGHPPPQRAIFCADNETRLRSADPDTTGLQNRVADNWRPLYAVADLAGGEWPARVRKNRGGAE